MTRGSENDLGQWVRTEPTPGPGPARPELKFVAIERTVKRGGQTIALCSSRTMTKRIANALNAYQPNEKGY